MAAFAAMNSRHFLFPISPRFAFPALSTPFSPTTSFSPRRPLTWPGRSHVKNPGPPSSPPPEPGSPPEEDTTPIKGLEATFYRIQDGVQIFLAILFWMSLFFWASAWDGRNKSRPDKGSGRR